ncbi:hypothetical protein Dsin_004900 [Dipteronia sinensis]|uniref:DUF4283 domain-containing protein n=1 Tax=Dipteronia sinensis TaxID=43782 RepID=A0AAE0EE44_9ROSI|nr:hypothetical protein Dsin_004900 [Dipteronia sinensis]
MKAKEIAKLCDSLTLKDNDGLVMPIRRDLTIDGVRLLALRLIGKLLSNKSVNREAFMTVVPIIWRTLEGFEIKVIDGNTFSFTFKNEDDRRRILQGGPWRFDNALLIIEEPTGKWDIQNMSFNKVAF